MQTTKEKEIEEFQCQVSGDGEYLPRAMRASRISRNAALGAQGDARKGVPAGADADARLISTKDED